MMSLSECRRISAPGNRWLLGLCSILFLGWWIGLGDLNHARSEQTPASRPDIVLFDFESGTYNGWTVIGQAWRDRPTQVQQELWTLIPQPANPLRFTGYEGDYLVSTQFNPEARGEEARIQMGPRRIPAGRLLSPPFIIERNHLTFRLSGLLNPGVRVALLVDEQEVRQAWSNNSYDLRPRGWDVSDLQGRQARIALIHEPGPTERTLMRVDHFVLSDQPVPSDWATRRLHARDSWALAVEEYRLLIPSHPDNFDDGHLVQGPDGRWHFFAQRAYDSPMPPADQQAILHSQAPSLQGPWSPPQVVMRGDLARGDRFLHTPRVVWNDGLFYMYFTCDSEPLTYDADGRKIRGPERIHLATSPDGVNWTRRETPVVEDAPFARDAAIVRQGNRWLMYYTGGDPPARQTPLTQALVARSSTDLVNWTDRTPVLLDGSATGGNIRHPWFINTDVFEHEGRWYVISGPSFGSFGGRIRWMYRAIWQSQDPLKFDWENDYLGNIDGFPVLQVVRDTDGSLWAATCSPDSGGLWLARLKILPQSPEIKTRNHPKKYDYTDD